MESEYEPMIIEWNRSYEQLRTNKSLLLYDIVTEINKEMGGAYLDLVKQGSSHGVILMAHLTKEECLFFKPGETIEQAQKRYIVDSLKELSERLSKLTTRYE